MKNREKWIQILGDEYFTPSVYRDEPILRTASMMQGYMPEKYRQMRRIALQNEPRRLSVEEIFYRQAKFMEDYEDEFEYAGNFFRYFPTYQSMSDLQLRGYFSWRTQVRRGNIAKTSLSFVFIYLYELINCIGSASPEEGYAKLRDFAEIYSGIDTHIQRYVRPWMRDFVLWYGLDKMYLCEYFDLSAEQAMTVLADSAQASDDALFSAICACSSYNIAHSRFYKENPETVQAVVCRAYHAWAAYYEKGRKNTLFDAVFGKKYTTAYTMFSSAIFWQEKKHPDTEIVIGPFSRFSCKNGQWTYTKLWNNVDRKRPLGTFLRAVDSLMRTAASYPHTLKCGNVPKYQQKIIEESIRAYRCEQEKLAARTVKIDLTKLQDIRAAADSTRDKLIVEDEAYDLPQETASAPQPEAACAAHPFGLTDTEYAVLCALVFGGDVQVPLRGTGMLLSVVTDSINEKCYEEFADTVLVFEGDTPCVLGDYVEELRGYLL